MKKIVKACRLIAALSAMYPLLGTAQVPEGRILLEDYPFEDGYVATGVKIVERTWLVSGGNAAPMRWPGLGQMSWGPESHVPVEYFLPLRNQKPVSIVMVPGPAMTSELFTGTPDGRDGWAQLFSRAGYPVYVLNPGGEIRPFTLPRTIEEVWVLWGIGPEPGVPFSDSQFPIEHVGVLDNNWFKMPHLAFVEHTIPLLEEIGPTVFIGHGIRADTFFRTLWEDHRNVRGGITIEPMECPIGEEEDIRRLYVDAERALMTLWGDNRDRGQPFASERLVECVELVDAINAAGGYAETVLLPEHKGIYGNTNMMFLDLNSEEIAELVMAWVDENVVAEAPVVENTAPRRAAERPPQRE